MGRQAALRLQGGKSEWTGLQPLFGQNPPYALPQPLANFELLGVLSAHVGRLLAAKMALVALHPAQFAGSRDPESGRGALVSLKLWHPQAP